MRRFRENEIGARRLRSSTGLKIESTQAYLKLFDCLFCMGSICIILCWQGHQLVAVFGHHGYTDMCEQLCDIDVVLL